MRMSFELEFAEPLLGTAPGDDEIYQSFVADKCKNGVQKDEMEALPAEDQIEKGTTVFTRTADNVPCLWDYQVKGFFKDACGVLRRVPKSDESKLKAFKKVIDGLIFVYPRMIPLVLPNGNELGFCERPLRTSGPMGERVALARSEEAPAGTKIQIEVECLDDSLMDYVLDWFKYGEKRGLGQWRNSGKGRFKYREL